MAGQDTTFIVRSNASIPCHQSSGPTRASFEGVFRLQSPLANRLAGLAFARVGQSTGEERLSLNKYTTPPQPDSEDDKDDVLYHPALQRLRCSLCGDHLIPRYEEPLTDGILTCAGCTQCFHFKCCRRNKISTRAYTLFPEKWYHSPACSASVSALSAAVERGETPIEGGGGRSWQLVPVSPIKYGTKEMVPQQQQDCMFSALKEVLVPTFGEEEAMKMAAGTTYAMVLRAPEGVRSAALLDVFGDDVIKIDFVATAPQYRRQGHCRALLQGMEKLAGELGTHQLIAVCTEDDTASQSVWSGAFGFRKVGGRGLNYLNRRYPLFSTLQEGATLMRKELVPQTKRNIVQKMLLPVQLVVSPLNTALRFLLT